MMLYSKNGSIPKTETDGTEGWIEVEVAPTPGEGQEVVWWFPPGWVVRPVKPADEAGFVWDWSQSEEKWVKSAVNIIVVTPDAGGEVTPNIDISITPTVSAGDVITVGTATATISGE
jgi:hypothetical protein